MWVGFVFLYITLYSMQPSMQFVILGVIVCVLLLACASTRVAWSGWGRSMPVRAGLHVCVCVSMCAFICMRGVLCVLSLCFVFCVLCMRVCLLCALHSLRNPPLFLLFAVRHTRTPEGGNEFEGMQFHYTLNSEVGERRFAFACNCA